MPKSMADIYRISNRNRRRNKEKKKLQETGKARAKRSWTVPDQDRGYKVPSIHEGFLLWSSCRRLTMLTRQQLI
jgi:hypothetical protein